MECTIFTIFTQIVPLQEASILRPHHTEAIQNTQRQQKHQLRNDASRDALKIYVKCALLRRNTEIERFYGMEEGRRIEEIARV